MSVALSCLSLVNMDGKKTLEQDECSRTATTWSLSVSFHKYDDVCGERAGGVLMNLFASLTCMG